MGFYYDPPTVEIHVDDREEVHPKGDRLLQDDMLWLLPLLSVIVAAVLAGAILILYWETFNWPLFLLVLYGASASVWWPRWFWKFRRLPNVISAYICIVIPQIVGIILGIVWLLRSIL